MDTIELKYIDNVHMRVEYDNDGIGFDLQEKFEFYVPGYRFTPKYKHGIWDGKIRLFSPYKQKLYIGLIDELRLYCRNNDVELIIDPLIITTNDITEELIKEYIDTLKLPFTPYLHQYLGIYHSIKNKRTTLLSATSSGKSLIIYGITRWLQENITGKTLIVVPTINLVTQLYKDFDDYAVNTDWCSEDNVHQIYGGQDKYSDKSITISTWQSLMKMPKAFFSQFSAIIIDETHLAKSTSIKGILEKSNAQYKIGMTGTLDDAKSNEWVIQGLLGPKKQLTTSKDLMDRGLITPLEVNIVNIKHNTIDKKIVRKEHKEYQNEVDYILTHKKRNNFICNLANKINGNTLILFLKINHGKELKKILDEKTKESGKQVHLIYGNVKADIREEIRDKMENGIIQFKFDDIEINCAKNEYVSLSNGNKKFAKDINIDDDVSDNWIQKNLKV